MIKLCKKQQNINTILGSDCIWSVITEGHWGDFQSLISFQFLNLEMNANFALSFSKWYIYFYRLLYYNSVKTFKQ